MDGEKFSQLWPLASFILVHTGLVAYYAGKITGQLSELSRRVAHIDKLAEAGEFTHCHLHRQQLGYLAERVKRLEELMNGIVARHNGHE